MAVQDLTPQLRTRLSRLERLVGFFVTFATLLLLGGLGYYVYSTAERKGWFVTKAPYFTYLRSAAGLKVGDSVKLMGFDVGEITRITAEDPGTMFDVYIEFVIRQPFYGYIWDDSRVKVKAAGLLGARYLEVTKGGTSGTTNELHATYKEDKTTHDLTHVFLDREGVYTNWTKGLLYWLPSDEPPELSSQLDEVVTTAKAALPNILALTNELTRVLTNAGQATAHLDTLLVSAMPSVSNLSTITTNLALITGNIREPQGSLGEWILPTNLNQQLTLLLTNANTTVTNVNTNLVSVVENLNQSLESLASITSNLNAQVQANTNLVSGISKMIVDADDLVQGLKRHWLLRGAFKKDRADPQRTNTLPVRPRPLKPGER